MEKDAEYMRRMGEFLGGFETRGFKFEKSYIRDRVAKYGEMDAVQWLLRKVVWEAGSCVTMQELFAAWYKEARPKTGKGFTAKSVFNSTAVVKAIVLAYLNASEGRSEFMLTLEPSKSGKNFLLKVRAYKGAEGLTEFTAAPAKAVKRLDGPSLAARLKELAELAATDDAAAIIRGAMERLSVKA